MRLEYYALVVVLVKGEAASGAMGMNVTSAQRPVALISPVSPRHSIRATHQLLVVAIAVLMVLATVALLCCCYLWERQLRLRMQAARTSRHTPHVGDDTHSSGPQLGSSPSVIVLLGDDVTRTVAWGVPQRISTSVVSEAITTKPTSTNANQSLDKLTLS